MRNAVIARTQYYHFPCCLLEWESTEVGCPALRTYSICKLKDEKDNPNSEDVLVRICV